jgi:MFS family permease
MTDLQSAAERTVTEERTTRSWTLVVYSALAGVVLSIVWSPTLVDRIIAQHIANPVVGGDATNVAITGSVTAAVFAFITGVGGMFTACNIAVFGALAPLSARPAGMRGQLTTILRPIGWLAAGAVVVAGLYGAIGVFIGDNSPQLSNAQIGDVRVRSIQSAVAFTLIGAIMVWYALGKVGFVRGPLERTFQRRPWTEMAFLGALIGGFLIGRPFGMFRHMYEYAASTHNPFIGFMTFALQSLGNIVGVTILLILVTVLSRGRFQRWLAAKPGRAVRFTAVAFIAFGFFFIFYWGVKLGSRAGWYWFPTMPYS